LFLDLIEHEADLCCLPGGQLADVMGKLRAIVEEDG
jgi:hypothetical protein